MSQNALFLLLLAASLARAGSYGGGSGGNGGGNPAPAPSYQPPSQPASAPSGMSGSGAMPADARGAAPVSEPAHSGPGSIVSADGSEAGSESSEAEASADAKPAPMTEEDAAENFKTVVESYVAKNSSAGAWEYEEKGRTRPLVLVAVESSGLRKTGKSVYTGGATLRDTGTKRARRLEFTVDFSGANWKVVRVRSAAVAAKAKR